MAFTKITNADLNSRGATTLPDVPTITPAALKAEFDAPAKEVVAPKVNNLIDELEATTAAGSLGATAPTGRTGTTVQAVINDISGDLGTAEGKIEVLQGEIVTLEEKAHTHSNKALLDTYNQSNADIADAVSKKHSHSNKSLLDTYTQTDANLADAVSKKHSHSNKSLLDTYTQTDSDIADAVDKKHSHENKDLLDTYTQSDVDLTDAVEKKHSHNNKATLDKLYEVGGILKKDGDPLVKSIIVGSDTFNMEGDGTVELVEGENMIIHSDPSAGTIELSTTGGGGGSAIWGGITGHIEDQDDLQDVFSDIHTLGAKNLIPYPYYRPSGYSSSGMTATYDADGVITVNKTAGNSTAYFGLYNGSIILKPNTQYTLSIELENATNTSLYITINSVQIASLSNKSAGKHEVSFTTASTLEGNMIISFYWNKTVVETNVKVKPMLRLATDSDDTYQPYAETNYQLTHNKLSYEDNGVLGAKNLIPYPFRETTKVLNNVTFTDNGDGTVTVVTTAEGASENTSFYYAGRGDASKIPLKANRYKLSGCPQGGTSSTYYMYINSYVYGTSTASSGGYETGEGLTVSFSVDVGAGIYIYICKNTIITTPILFKPMLRLASDPDDTWQPYAMTNQELTGKLGTKEDKITVLPASKGGTGQTSLQATRNAMGLGDTTGALPVANGGTGHGSNGLTANAVLLGNGTSAFKTIATGSGALYATADNAQPVFGVLPVAQGGSGHATINTNAVLLGNGTSAFKNIGTASGAFYATSTNGQPAFGTLPVAQGGTGDVTLTSNALLVGNGTSGVKSCNSKSGACYSTGDGVMPVFGVLPVAQGGTGDSTLTLNGVLVGNGTSGIKSCNSANGACYSTGNNTMPVFGTLPIAQGGTGATTAANARLYLDVPAKGDLNSYALKSGAKFTGNVDTNGYLYVSNGSTSVGLVSGYHNSIQSINVTAPIQSNYGALILSALNSTHVVSIRGKEVHVKDKSDSSYMNIYAAAFQTASSRRYKENIQDLEDNEVRKILDVNVVTFDYKKDCGIAEDSKRHNKVGVIAEDVVDICPEVVAFKDIDGEMLPDSVDYSKFVPKLIKMIQIQEERINELEKKLNKK